MGKPKLMLSSMKAIHEAIIGLRPVSHYTCIPYSTKQQHDDDDDDEDEDIKKPLISNRLFFAPSMTKSIMEEARTRQVSYGDCVVMVVASSDPYVDFRESMEEMAVAHGLRRWEQLLELLRCYMRLNEEKDHAAIAMAFVDLVAALPLVSGSHPHSS